MPAPITTKSTSTRLTGLNCSSTQDSLLLELSIDDQSEMSPQATFEALPNAIGSPALAGGASHCDLADGQMTDLLGLPVCPVNPSQSRPSTRKLPPKVRPTIATYCPFSPRSLQSAALQS